MTISFFSRMLAKYLNFEMFSVSFSFWLNLFSHSLGEHKKILTVFKVRFSSYIFCTYA